ncbi:MAG: heavy-metal-associated domain-containing protein [Bacteroidetes bacterium]|nr:heavy-metal-associated domain-containing protein [Bacteroidota bacterium]
MRKSTFQSFVVGGMLLSALAFPACGSEASADTVVEVHLTAPGMHCDGCTATVEETIAKMAGVDSVRADLASKDVFVLVDTALTPAAELHNLIVKLGFAAPSDELE